MQNLASKRILFVDDEPHMHKIVKISLETIGGWEVMVANSGAEGIVKAEDLKPDAILLDVMMPEMDGIACLKKLQLNIQAQSIPVIFLTSILSFTEANQFLALGAVGAIAKPFNPVTLVSEIAKILGWNLENSETQRVQKHYIS
ncbi:response regulator [Chlorogloeopsis fritschii PCC 9212]|uniref:Response regulator n=1 Tax=Chlorogloeopsis fritschii PCC 6912 TaxID=211165 RepID=A0A3S0ZLN6_CHLFR|nr:response regulator [Chlorogloeopsis fritschii]RUR78754.1 response regulator [Chlorogloeopsis fritschii PCC 6912]